MDSRITAFFPYFFPLFFIGMWLFITTLLAVVSGWFDLARRYPDTGDKAILVLRLQSGRLGMVAMSRILRLEVCAAGLRIGIWRPFGLFSKDFMVPWGQIAIARRKRLFWNEAKLDFGGGQSLTLMDYVANRLARAVPGKWPEQGRFTKETVTQSGWGVLKLWIAGTALAAAFFTFAPRLAEPHMKDYPPLFVTIGFPAIVFGVGALVQFFRRIRE